MKKFFVLCTLLLSAATLRAQQIDSRLTSLVPRPSANHRSQTVQPTFDPEAVRRDINVTFNDDGTVRSLSAFAILKPGAECPTERLKSLGISVSDVIGPLVLMQVPAERLYDLEGVGEIERVEADQMNQLHTDVARQKIGVTVLDGTAAPVPVSGTETSGETMVPAWQAAGLPHAYTGKGVVVGVVDDGIEFNHIAFKDQDGNSRVKKVMMGYDKNGKLIAYTNPSTISSLETDDTNESHGTHTSGIAAGSVISSYTKRDLRGVATESDLVLCGLSKDLSDSRIIQGVKGVFHYADSVSEADGKFVPAVVNISLGSNDSRHDGLTPCCIACNELTLNGTKPGRVVVVSAGNEGAEKMSIQQTLGTPDADGYQLRTLLKSESQADFCRYRKGLRMFLYSTEEFDCDLKVVELDNSGNVAKIYPLSSLSDIKNGDMILESGNNNVDYYQTISGSDKGIYYHRLTVPPNAAFYQYSESGLLWDNFEKNLYVGVFVKGQQGQTIRMTTHPGLATFEGTADGVYTYGTADLSINVNACSDAIISVGSYISRVNWPPITGSPYSYTNPSYKIVDAISPFSSYGIDDNGIVRPDILAPGTPILSAYNGYDLSYFYKHEIDKTTGYNPFLTDEVFWGIDSGSDEVSEEPEEEEEEDEEEEEEEQDEEVSAEVPVHYYYGRMQGTSMAAPMVAGIIALWLEQDPTLSTVDVRRILRLTAHNDDYTTDKTKTPSGTLIQAGMGKVDALAGMQQIVSQSANTLVLQEGSDNSDAITAMDGQKDVTVTLDGRTFYKDGAWNTLCLPFDVNMNQSPLNGDGVTVKKLDAASSSLSADGTLTLHFSSVSAAETLKAGMPYLIKWDNLTSYSYNKGVEPPHTIVSPTFRYVTIDASTPEAVTLAGVFSFQGTYAPITVPDGGDPTLLYLGSDNTLYYPSSSDISLNAQRAYFHLATSIIDPETAEASIRSIIFHLDGDAGEDVSTGIIALSTGADGSGRPGDSSASEEWHTLQGVRLAGRPAARGIYLKGGRKVWVR